MIDFRERVDNILSSLDLGPPILKVKVSNRSIMLRQGDWDSKLDQSDFMQNMVKDSVRRIYDFDEKKFKTNDRDDICEEILDDATSNAPSMFIATSHYDKPRRTKAFKDFCAVYKRNKGNTEFRKDMLGVYEYFWTVTRTDSIKKKVNDVHRKNIYNLLCLMEKKYGKTSSNK